MVKRKVSGIASSSINRRGQLKGLNGEGVVPIKKGLNKGKKKVREDPVFEEEELEDTSIEYDDEYDEYDEYEDDEDGVEDDEDAEEDAEDDADEEENEELVNQARVQGMFLKFLQEQAKYRKRKAGGGVGKKKLKRAKVESDVNLGQRVMRKGVVIKTQSQTTQKAPNLNGVKAFANLVVQFDESRKKVVTEMGFGSLLKIPVTCFPRKFAYKLLTRVGGDGSVMFGDGYVFPLSPVQIQCVLGIPMGSRQLPSNIPDDDNVKAEVSHIKGLFAKGNSISVPIAGAALFRWDSNAQLVPLRSEVEKSHFRIAFLIVVLGYLLCPTTNTTKLASKLTPALIVYQETGEYDWCSWNLDWLCCAANKFQKKFTNRGYVAGSGGCFLFLLLFYIDHLRRVPVQWGVMSRITVWTPKKIKDALNADIFPSGDYGKMKSMIVAYGEAHPLGDRDTTKSDVDHITAVVVERVTPQLMSAVDVKLNSVIESVKSMKDLLTRSFGSSTIKVIEVIDNGKANESAVETGNVGSLDNRDFKSVCDAAALEYEYEAGGLVHPGYDGVDQGVDLGVDMGLGRYNTMDQGLQKGEDHVNEMGQAKGLENAPKNVETEVTSGNKVGDQCNIKGVEELIQFEEDDKSEPEDEDVAAENPCSQVVVGLVGHRGTKVWVDNGVQETENSSEYKGENSGSGDDEGMGSNRKRAVKQTEAALCAKSSSTRRHTPFESRMLKFVRGWKDSRDPLSYGPVMICCEKNTATQRDCFGVVHPRSRVGDGYVRTVSALYNKHWTTKQFVNRSKRIMLDPSFSNRIMLNENKDEHIAKKYGKALLVHKLCDVRTVFIPVLEVPPKSPDDSHWWCLAINLKGRSLWMIDSLFPDPYAKHKSIIELLVRGIDVMFSLCDPGWTTGEMKQWTRSTISVMEPSDTSYCGVFMLACIKFCARMFTTKFGLGKISSARENLFLDDLLSDENEMKEKLESILPAPRKTNRSH